MPSWLLKSAAQRCISLLPASSRWNELFQTYVTRSLDLTPERFEMRLAYCGRHLEHLLDLRPELQEGFSVFELGTGWYPVVPMGLYLCGAEEIWTYDIAPLLNGRRMQAMTQKFLEYDSSGRLECFLPRLRADRLAVLRSLMARGATPDPVAFVGEMNIHVRVGDAQSTGLPAGVVDLFVSTGVLEYIPEFVLKHILREFQRLGRGRAVQSHYLNLADQYSYFDKSITPFNFLRFSPRAWGWLNSPLTWQNRLRISDFRNVFKKAGFRITKEENLSGSPEDLSKVPLDPQFQSCPREDLLVLFSWVVAEPA